MKTIFKTVIILLILMTIFSCKQDSNNPSQPAEPNVLLKSVSIDSNETTYQYNEDKTLYSVGKNSNIYSITYTANHQIASFGNFTFSYNSQNRIKKITDNSNNYYADLVYNADGLIARKDTYLFSPNSIYTTFYTYNSSKQLIKQEEQEGGSNQIYKMEYEYDVNNNISKKTEFSSYDNGATFNVFSSILYTYDDKKNPNYLTLTKIGETNLLTFIPLPEESIVISELIYFKLQYFSPNNVISETYTTGNISYDYTYGDYDYPLTKEKHLPSGIISHYHYTYDTY